MKETYATFPLLIWGDIHNATSSLASEDGVTLCDLPVGPTTSPCGRVHAPVNLSARQAEEKGLLTSGTYGRTSTGSLSSAALQSSLASRLQARTASAGSTLYTLTWKDRVTPSGRRICALRASAHRTSDNDFTGWPTPTTRDFRDGHADGTVEEKSILGRIVWRVKNLDFGTTQIGCTAETAHRGQLNPAHSRWLMGFPLAWDDCGVMAMPSFRKSRKNS